MAAKKPSIREKRPAPRQKVDLPKKEAPYVSISDRKRAQWGQGRSR